VRKHPLIAFFVLAYLRGKSGVKHPLSRVVLWRVGMRWYVIALDCQQFSRVPLLVCITSSTDRGPSRSAQ
jgi:hypothetical protein